MQRETNEFSPSNIHGIVTILSDDPVLAQNRDRFRGALGLSTADTFIISNRASTNYEYFNSILTIWIGRNGLDLRIDHLITILRNANFMNAAGQLQAKYAPDQVRPEPIQRQLPQSSVGGVGTGLMTLTEDERVLKEKRIMRLNFDFLIENTSNWNVLKRKLVANGLFTTEELDILEGKGKGVESTIYFELYKDVQRKPNFLNLLIRCFEDSNNQTPANRLREHMDQF